MHERLQTEDANEKVADSFCRQSLLSRALEGWYSYAEDKSVKKANVLLANNHFTTSVLASTLLQWQECAQEQKHLNLTTTKALAFWSQGTLARSQACLSALDIKLQCILVPI